MAEQHLRERRDGGQWEEFEEEVGLLLGLEGWMVELKREREETIQPAQFYL